MDNDKLALSDSNPLVKVTDGTIPQKNNNITTPQSINNVATSTNTTPIMNNPILNPSSAPSPASNPTSTPITTPTSTPITTPTSTPTTIPNNTNLPQDNSASQLAVETTAVPTQTTQISPTAVNANNTTTSNITTDNNVPSVETMTTSTNNTTEPEIKVIGSETPTDQKPKKKKTSLIILIIIFVVLLAGGAVCFLLLGGATQIQFNIGNSSDDSNSKPEPEKDPVKNLGDIQITGNGIDDFDLAFLKLEDDNKDIVYSPFSIKYALTMLNEGAEGDSKEQIAKIIGNYIPKKYTNSQNLSLANALFVNEVHKDKIKEAYSTNLQTKYNAEVVFDTFETPDNINSWIENKTLSLIKETLSETDPTYDYLYLVNALAIDMEWRKKLGPVEGIDTEYSVSFPHIKDGFNLASYADEKEASIAATAEKYDFIKELGEDSIKQKIQEGYEKWSEENQSICSAELIAENVPDFDAYIETLKSYNGHLSSSTDFEFYDDDSIKAFAKDLKEYDNTTLQYVGIMPKNQSLNEYINNVSAEQLSEIVTSLKPIALDSFSDGVLTILTGKIPFFSFDYELKLKDDLMKLGITNVFNEYEAGLKNISDEDNFFVKNAVHKANIDFSNEGIKAGAVTVLGLGKGGGGDCNFNYQFEIPIEKIDLNFDSPYLFFIRDKKSGEVWFMGSVYDEK